MLSLFPSLLDYGLLAPLLLRLTLGMIFVHWAYAKLTSPVEGRTKALGVLEAIVGLMFIVGIFTQLAALVAALIFVVHIVSKVKSKAFFTDGVNYYFILFIISISLLVLGAGRFSFDIPL